MNTLAVPSQPLQARDIMSNAPVIAHPEDDLFDVIAVMVHEVVRHVVIVDTSVRAVGILSDRDVRALVGEPTRALERADRRRHAYLSVEAVMVANPITVADDTTIAELARHLVEERIGALPVVDHEDQLVGLVSYVDLLYCLWLGAPADHGGGAEQARRSTRSSRFVGQCQHRRGRRRIQQRRQGELVPDR